MVLVKNKEQIANIQIAGSILKHIFQEIDEYIKPGMSSLDLNDFIHSHILTNKAEPAFLGYNSFPAVACISVNDEIIHGIPRKDKYFSDNDLVSVDIGVNFKGGIADASRTYHIGTQQQREDVHRLISSTRQALQSGIEMVSPLARISQISQAIFSHAEHSRLGVVKEFCGHGVGIHLHEPPDIPNYFSPQNTNIRLKEGMIIAIEPMFSLGSGEILYGDDNFTICTKDGSLAAHFEHTVLVTAHGHEVLT